MDEQSAAAAGRSASAGQNWASGWRARTVGLGQEVPLLDGRLVPYISLDNAASTPPLRDVVDAVQRFLPYYSSVHRGAGFKSRVSTAAYHDAHETLARFVGAETTTNTVVFGKNTTEAINKLAFRYPLGRRSVVLSTAMEHHSNDLPWRGRATVVRATVTPEGRVDEDDVDRLLAAYGERIALMTVSGASNVTGFVQPVHRLARKAHAVGAHILVDAAQLAPHRRIDVKPDDDPEHLDFVALSGHKMYAPFGTGVLVGRRDIFLQSAPEYQGGGTVDIVTPDEVHWAELPDREEAGSPNVVGAVATAAAARALMDAGMEDVERHEALLTTYALERLQPLPGISLYGASDPHRTHDRVGVIAFNLAPIHHALVAAILGYEGGIGVRSGCFCAQPYVAHLLERAEPDQAFWHRAIRDRDRSRRPGMVRISLGIYNTPEDIDALVEMLQRIARNDYKGTYGHVPQSGDCTPVGYEEVLPTRFSVAKQLVTPRSPRQACHRWAHFRVNRSRTGLQCCQIPVALTCRSASAQNRRVNIRHASSKQPAGLISGSVCATLQRNTNGGSRRFATASMRLSCLPSRSIRGATSGNATDCARSLAQIDRHAESIDEIDAEGILAFAERILPQASDLWVQASITSSGFSSCSFRKAWRSTEIDSIEPP